MTVAISVTALVVGACSSGVSEGSASTTSAPVEAETTPRLVAPKDSSFSTAMGSVRLACQGSGPVPVVLIAGTDDPIQRWDDLVSDLGQEVLVCRFDADAAALDGPLAGTITPERRAGALAEALRASGLPPPYVLVGHSLGGLTVRRFGTEHGDLLGGALLLDPTTPLALAYLDRLLDQLGWDVAGTREDALTPAPWPDVALTVLSHDPTEVPFGDPVEENLWTKGQHDYGKLTPEARVEAVPGSGHYVDRDAPERVTCAIDDLVRRAE